MRPGLEAGRARAHQLHHAPQPCVVRVAGEAEQLAAVPVSENGEEDTQRERVTTKDDEGPTMKNDDGGQGKPVVTTVTDKRPADLDASAQQAAEALVRSTCRLVADGSRLAGSLAQASIFRISKRNIQLLTNLLAVVVVENYFHYLSQAIDPIGAPRSFTA